jgi:L-fuculose-phosphate aldolase
MDEQLLKKKLAKVCHLLYRQGVATLYEGNVSCRVSDNRFFIKKTESSFRTITPDGFVLMDENGRPLTNGTPSRENFLHLKIYQNRPDVVFVVHTHPPQVIRAARIYKGQTFSDSDQLKGEAFNIGDVPMVEFFPPGSDELASKVAEVLKKPDRKIAVLREHGLVVVGKTVEEAFDLTLFMKNRCEAMI